MTKKNKQNEPLKNIQLPEVEYFQELTSSAKVEEAGSRKITDLELDDLGKNYGVKETLSYALGLDMENPEQTGDHSEDDGK